MSFIPTHFHAPSLLLIAPRIPSTLSFLSPYYIYTPVSHSLCSFPSSLSTIHTSLSFHFAHLFLPLYSAQHSLNASPLPPPGPREVPGRGAPRRPGLREGRAQRPRGGRLAQDQGARRRLPDHQVRGVLARPAARPLRHRGTRPDLCSAPLSPLILPTFYVCFVRLSRVKIGYLKVVYLSLILVISLSLRLPCRCTTEGGKGFPSSYPFQGIIFCYVCQFIEGEGWLSLSVYLSVILFVPPSVYLAGR